MLFISYIGRRLSLSADGGKSRRSAGTVVAVVGVALAIAIMIISVSVVTGFKSQIRHKVEGFNSQITLYPVDALSDSSVSAGIRLTPGLLADIHAIVPQADAALTLRQPAIFKTDSAFQGVVLKASQGEWLARFLADNLTAGRNLPPATLTSADSIINTVLVSRSTATALRLGVGDRLTVHFLRDNNVATRCLNIVGIFDTHFTDYDRLYAFTPPAFLQRLNRLDSLTGSAVEITGIPSEQSDILAGRLEQSLLAKSVVEGGGRQYVTDSVINSGAIYFSWLDLLDTNVVVIIILMSLVASFTIISSLFILILERVSMIGLFKALGATNATIRRIFIYLAERLVVVGLLWGNIIGIGLVLLQMHFHIIPLDPEAYYLNYVPVQINWLHILIIDIAAVILSSLVLILPSGIIAKMSPAATMRFE